MYLATSNKVIPAKGSEKITYLLIRRILFACNNRDDNLILHKRFALFSIEMRFSPFIAIASSHFFFRYWGTLLLLEIFEYFRMNKKFWRHSECIIRRWEFQWQGERVRVKLHSLKMGVCFSKILECLYYSFILLEYHYLSIK